MEKEKKKRSRRNSQRSDKEMDNEMKTRLENHVDRLYQVQTNKPVKSKLDPNYIRTNLM